MFLSGQVACLRCLRWRRDQGRAGERQREPKRRAAASAVAGPDLAAMRRGDRAANREAQPHAFPGSRSCGAMELVENTLLLTRRNTSPAIAYFDEHLAGHRLRANLDRSAAVFHRVF